MVSVATVVAIGAACMLTPTAQAGQIANVEYVHAYIQHKHGITVPIKETNVKKAVNVKYVLCAVDKANEILNGSATTDYCTHTLAAETTVNGVKVNPAADTVAVKSAVDRLIAISRTTSTISADYNNGIYTWNGQEHGLPDTYNGQTVASYGYTGYNAGLSATLDGNAAIYPTYYVQSMCSSTSASTQGTLGTPTYSSTGVYCWCRLKRRSDNANAASLAFYGTHSSDAYCGRTCANICVNATANGSAFRSAVLAAF
jgi:hypothetical protein